MSAGEPLAHTPVMAAEVLELLSPPAGGTTVDFTVGAGGHARLLAERLGRQGRLLGFDKDPEALRLAEARLRPSPQEAAAGWPAIELVQASFAAAASELAQRGVAAVDAALADLGLSSMQLAAPGRGFSFLAEAPLDMRMDPRQALTAEQVVNQFSERELADLIYQFGEERRSRRIARAIVRARPLRTCAELARVVAAASRSMKSSRRAQRLHPATRTFQALRICVNSELEELEQWLEQLPALLAPGGRAAVIAFHSLEDRRVKQAFRQAQNAGQARLLTPHPLRPSAAEQIQNPRARSARLRGLERMREGDRGHDRTLRAENR